MEHNKDIEWYLDMDCDTLTFPMDTTDVGIVLLPLTGIVLLPLCLPQCRLAAAQCT